MQADLSPAYILHTRPYRDSSVLVDLLSLEHGLQRAVWRGARSQRKGLKPQLFVPLLITLGGRGELRNLNQVEVAGSFTLLQGQALFSGLYLNELLVRLLRPGDPQTLIFAAYQQALEALAADTAVEPVLRQFEWQLLDVMGYGFSLTEDAHGQPLEPHLGYAWYADQGLLPLAAGAFPHAPAGLPGSALLAMARADWDAPLALRTAKQLMRQALAVHLGDRPLVSRQLFVPLATGSEGDKS
ncbi:MAG: DNA repair protein RecO [Pseudomonas sp.]